LSYACPLVTVIPGMCWSICAFTAELATNLIPGQGPAWMSSPMIQVLGSPWWLLVGGLLMIGNVVSAYPTARSASKPQAVLACQRCGYDLTGNVSGVCPECGTGVPGRVADAAGAVPTKRENEKGGRR